MRYRHNVGFGESIAMQMADFVSSLDWAVDVLIPVPLGQKRLKERGYNQVVLVARPRANRMRSQVGLSVAQRSQNVQGADLADSRVVNGKSILIMDDIPTTGSTISACTAALLTAGAKEVYVLTIARALPHHGLDRV